MARVKYKIDIRTLPFIQAEKTLVAVIGTIEKPMYAVFYNKGNTGNAFSLTVESPNDIVCQQWVGPVTVVNAATELIEGYKKIVDNIELQDSMAEDDEDEVTYYCNNLDCGAKGLITEPLMDEAGRMTCPYCGMELDEEEKVDDYDITYDRLMEIASTLILYIDYAFGKTKDKKKECRDELEVWGIEPEEIEYIENM